MLSRYNAATIESVLGEEGRKFPFPRVSDRKAWQKVRESAGEAYCVSLVALAEEYMQMSLPVLRATDILDYFRTGQREVHEKACVAA